MKTITTSSLLLILCTGLMAQAGPARKTAQPNPAKTAQSAAESATSWRQLLNSESATLDQVRSVFVGQSVTVGGELNVRSQLLEWRIATNPLATAIRSANPDLLKAIEKMPYVVRDDRDGLPADYSGKTARVIAIQLHKAEESGTRTNALGDAISDDEIINPYFDIVVKFDDGTTALTTQYPNTLAAGSVVELASIANATTERMMTELPGFVGKTVYAVGFSRLYRTDTTLDEIAGRDIFKRVSASEIPLLEPLKIVATKYVESTGVVIEIQLPSGKKALSLTSKIQLDAPLGEGVDQTFFERAIGALLAGIPNSLSKKDLDAIRIGTIYRGMDEQALDYAMGFPDKENDWGSGGKQLIYGKSFIVYVNRQGTVVDWQSFDNK